MTVWGRAVDDSQPGDAASPPRLSRSAFRTTIKILPCATYYTTTGNASTPDKDIGWARWLEDYPHLADWFDVLPNGNRITAQNNNNYSNANVSAQINRMIEYHARADAHVEGQRAVGAGRPSGDAERACRGEPRVHRLSAPA